MKLAAAALLAGALACCSLAHAQQGMRKGEWHYWGGDAGATRYSTLDQINAGNARELEIAWRWQSLPGEGQPDVNFKATPLMIDGVLYTSAGVHQAAAIDPRSGMTLWVFTPEPRTITGRGGVPPSGRGVAYWSDGREKRVFLNTLDGRLISIDARTGRADPKFGTNGTVLLKEQLTDRPVAMVGSSSPPIVVGNVVVVQTVSEVAASNKEAVPGHIRGYDVRTGKRLWTFHTIPQRGEPGVETWEKDSWKYTGNAGVWTLMSADPELGYVYLPIETPSHDFYGGHRPGDNLYAESIVCLDAQTGKRVWHFQVVHHGVWDYDPPAAPILGDITVNGRRIPSVTLLTKQASRSCSIARQASRCGRSKSARCPLPTCRASGCRRRNHSRRSLRLTRSPAITRKTCSTSRPSCAPKRWRSPNATCAARCTRRSLASSKTARRALG